MLRLFDSRRRVKDVVLRRSGMKHGLFAGFWLALPAFGPAWQCVYLTGRTSQGAKLRLGLLEWDGDRGMVGRERFEARI